MIISLYYCKSYYENNWKAQGRELPKFVAPKVHSSVDCTNCVCVSCDTCHGGSSQSSRKSSANLYNSGKWKKMRLKDFLGIELL